MWVLVPTGWLINHLPADAPERAGEDGSGPWASATRVEDSEVPGSPKGSALALAVVTLWGVSQALF